MTVLTKSKGCSLVGTIWLLASTLLGAAANAQPVTAYSEPQVKAAYLLNFLRYVEWPDDTSRTSGGPVRVTVVGDDEVASELRRIRIRFEVALDSAEKNRLRVSSRLLAVALRIRKGDMPPKSDASAIIALYG